MNNEPKKLRATDLTPEGQKYFLEKTRGQMILWVLLILALLAATGATGVWLYFDFR